jgi:DNA-binding CsgD family transcriptional regulator
MATGGPIDLWADVAPASLPASLVEAFDRQDWPQLKTELRTVMDGLITDGPYGRELLGLIRRLPVGMDPVFDRYRAMVSVDFGDWDGLNRCLEATPIDPTEIVGLRDILLAPLDQADPPSATELHHCHLFRLVNHQFGLSDRARRHWIMRMQHYRPVQLWTRGDVATSRHVRYRQLHDAFMLAVAEVCGGRLPVAISLAMEAKHLGLEGEPLRLLAYDLELHASAAVGDLVPETVAAWDLIPRSRGPSPLASWQFIAYLMPLSLAVRSPSLIAGSEIGEHAAAGLGSPRALFQAQCWAVAAGFALNDDRAMRALPGLLAQTRNVAAGLRVLPHYLSAIASQQPDRFRAVADEARGLGHTWIQVAALLWATALSPHPHEARRLMQLLDLTGWRRAALVPESIAAEAALGLTSLGMRGRALIELAAVAGRPNVTFEVARQHVENRSAPPADVVHALDALSALDTTRARELLRRLSSRSDEVGARAKLLSVGATHPNGLSDRELEVLALAGEGRTNRQIAQDLTLSPHTVARHLANARTKLGAANRAEAATRVALLRSAVGAVERSSADPGKAVRPRS